MKSTRERILETALAMFNEQGSDAVSIRDIAGELKISPGNFTYYFKNTDEIIRELYFELAEKSGRNFSLLSDAQIDLRFLVQTTVSTFELIEQYKFLFLDMVRIIRRSDELHEHYTELMKIRKRQMKAMLQILVNNAYLSKNLMDDFFRDYEDYSFILADYWLSNAELMYTGKRSGKIKHYSGICLSPLKPFMTKKGRSQYLEIMNSL